MTIDTAKEREHLRDPDVDHLLTAHRYLDVIDAQAAEIERLREAIDAIEILNETSADENGRRWENSDLIGQEIRSARASFSEREP